MVTSATLFADPCPADWRLVQAFPSFRGPLDPRKRMHPPLLGLLLHRPGSPGQPLPHSRNPGGTTMLSPAGHAARLDHRTFGSQVSGQYRQPPVSEYAFAFVVG